MALLQANEQNGGDRHARILGAALEIFSRSSFGDATTQEIARRARVSKRDIYAAFPDKHAILIAVVNTVLQSGDAQLQQVVADCPADKTSTQDVLELIGLSLIGEILSPLKGFVCRLVFSESLGQPPIGVAYFDNWYSRRSGVVAEVLARRSSRSKGKNRRSTETLQAARHFVALLTHLPQLTVSLGMANTWNSKSIQNHVKGAVECFLKAYPEFA